MKVSKFNDFDITPFLGVSKSDVKMSSDTSYKQQFDQKKITKVKQFSFEDGKWLVILAKRFMIKFGRG